MWAYLSDLFASDGYLPLGACMQWNPGLLALRLTGDGLTVLAYLIIPAALGYLMLRRPGLGNARFYTLFGIFILAGAIANLLGIWVIWQPDYVAEGSVKLVAAFTSAGTAIVLCSAMPRLLATPSNPELEAMVREKTAALASSEQRFRDFANTASDWLWETDADLRITYFSERAGSLGDQVIGLRRDQIDVLDPNDAGWVGHLSDLAARRPFRDFVYGWRDRDGRTRHSRVSGMPRFDSEGRFQGYRGTSTDVTVEVEAELRAARAHDRLIDAIESLPAHFMLFDREGKLVLCNSSRPEMLPGADDLLHPGTPAEALFRRLLEQGLVAAAIGREEDWLRERLAQFRRGGTDMEVLGTSGRWIQVVERRTSEGGVVTIRLDVTERHEMEDQLRQAQKMEAVGQLTGGVAHDFNNLLTVVIGQLDLIAEAVAQDPALSARVAATIQAAERGADLTRRLLAFSRRQALRPQVVELNPLVQGMGGLLRRSLGEAIELQFALDDGLWPTLVDPGQVENALLNIALNSRDAMPRGGKLTIETGNRHLDADYVAHEPEVAEGDYVMLAVSDTGTGMAPEVLERAFEPFFTTKEVGQGSGLGLSMVYGFAKQSGGHVKIYSEPGHGTTVRLYLPRATRSDGATGQAEATAEPRGGSETVLAVEDDGAVRRLAVNLLTSLGYRVVEAVDGHAALALLRQRDDIDLLFTDMVMPGGMSGSDLAREARLLRPGLKVLFTTGYTRAAATNNGTGPGGDVIVKPYRKQDLARMLRRVLDGEAAQGR